jgi:Zn-dependent protease
MGTLSLVQEILIWTIPVLFAVTVHEVAHGWVANKLGDRTAFMLGRLSLNPFKHIDPIGTVVVPLFFLLVGNFIFGWAKPVPVNWRNLKHPRRDAALVAIAGPLSNFLMALLWLFVLNLGAWLFQNGFSPAIFFIYVGQAGITINLLLMILNLVPIPPLDGSRVVSSLLSARWAMVYDAVEPYGLIILVLLIVTKILPLILQPPLEWMQNFFMYFSLLR